MNSTANARVAMVGGGQLARMTYQAALRLGVTLTVLDPDPLSPAVQAGAQVLPGRADCLADLAGLARLGRVLTFDHERVPIDHIRVLEEAGVNVAPGADIAELSFDKAVSRRRLGGAGFPVPIGVAGKVADDIETFAASHGWPVVVKAARGGYDGRGVAVVSGPAAAGVAAEELGPDLVIEEFVPYDAELAVLVARSSNGEIACYDPVSTMQRDGICHEVLAPAAVPSNVRRDAMELAEALARRFELVGVMAVELFLVADKLLVNELATRPHNSAHHTIEAAETSQFEQHLRAILGWPLGSTALRASAAATYNVLGASDSSDPRSRLPEALAIPGAHVHLYSKVAKPGRKLGHVTALASTRSEARAIAERAATILSGPTEPAREVLCTKEAILCR